MATIRDVANKAGVSISTVSLALNSSGPVSADTRAKILKAAREVGYEPNQLAQGLKSGRSRLIGVVVGDLANPFFSSMLRAIERIAMSENYLVIIADTQGDVEQEMAILKHLVGLRVAGIILHPMGQGETYTSFLRSITVPTVTFDQKVDGLDRDLVASDNVLASAMLTQLLIRHGHRRICHISGIPGLWTTEMRIEGFRTSMEAENIPVDEDLQVSGNYEGTFAYEKTIRLLTQSKRPTAILAASNVMALGTLQAILDLGLKCPEEISLTTVDDVPWSDVIKPKLTMVIQPIEDMAETICQWLFERIELGGAETLERRETLKVPKLIVGESCAPPPQS